MRFRCASTPPITSTSGKDPTLNTHFVVEICCRCDHLWVNRMVSPDNNAGYHDDEDNADAEPVYLTTSHCPRCRHRRFDSNTYLRKEETEETNRPDAERESDATALRPPAHDEIASAQPAVPTRPPRCECSKTTTALCWTCWSCGELHIVKETDACWKCGYGMNMPGCIFKYTWLWDRKVEECLYRGRKLALCPFIGYWGSICEDVDSLTMM